MGIVFFLIIFPVLAAIILLFVKNSGLRDTIVRASAVIIAAAAILLTMKYIKGGPEYFKFESVMADNIILGLELLVGIFVFYMGIKYKKALVSLLVFLQVALTVWFELTKGHKIKVEYSLFVDSFSLIMVLIIGIIGSIICVYALGYMKDFQHHHKDSKDDRPVFFFLMFLFLSAMFGIVLSNNLLWLYFFWEVTTLCSFLLIGYTKTEEAINNSFRALVMNLLGGLAFAMAIVYLGSGMEMGPEMGILELDKLIAVSTMYGAGISVIPVILLSFAGITKAAQMPFSSWLLGAMVAPTPTSALLHSSTMVKAGVYIIIRLAPVLGMSFAGLLVTMIGGITFMIASFIAISQSNAKKVLAYSTVANLGLIVACGGIGTYEAVWAGILLIIFHAVAKSLLFLCVGTVEHNIGSRNIEDMDGLVVIMPKIAVMMLIGIAGMFLAPFGMLISKWAALKAFVDTKNPLLVMMLVFGSSATLFFWTKWMGKLVSIINKQESKEKNVHKDEWAALIPLAAMTVIICLAFPLVSGTMIEPYLYTVFGPDQLAGLSEGNLRLMTIMMAMVILLPIGLLFYGKDDKIVPVYLAGANVGDNMKFQGSAGKIHDLTLKNYYMEKYFGEKKLALLGVVTTTAIFIFVFSLILAKVIGGVI